MPTAEELTEIERAGRRCAICHSGRRWRELEVVAAESGGQVVMCAGCRARFGAAPPVAVAEPVVAEPVAKAKARAKPEAKEPKAPREDRLRKALRELPREPHSVGQIAKAAGLNHDKTLSRLHALAEAGEVQQVGKRWSNEPPSTDVEAAFDRLQARTTNLRIVRDRETVA